MFLTRGGRFHRHMFCFFHVYVVTVFHELGNLTFLHMRLNVSTVVQNENISFSGETSCLLLLFCAVPHSNDKQLGILHMHYHTDIMTHLLAYEVIIYQWCNTGWTILYHASMHLILLKQCKPTALCVYYIQLYYSCVVQ